MKKMDETAGVPRLMDAAERRPGGPASESMQLDFEALFAEYGARFVELASALVGSRTEAEDVVQEAFVKAYRARDRFRGESMPSTWIRRIVLNEAVERRRRRRPRSAAGVDLDTLETAAPGPEARADALERAEAVRRAVDALPEEQRTVVVLREFEGLTFREISEMLDLPLGTVESRAIRARERLRGSLRRHLWQADEGAEAPR